MAKNANMHAAKKNQNDEFYTQLADIENVYDDVVMSSVFYSRLLEMNLPQERFIQSLNGENLLLKYGFLLQRKSSITSNFAFRTSN